MEGRVLRGWGVRGMRDSVGVGGECVCVCVCVWGGGGDETVHKHISSNVL